MYSFISSLFHLNNGTRRCLLFACCLLIITCSFAQPKKYTVANAHSHNDYKQAIPFFAAYAAGFGSVEADIFLQDNQLLVAHSEAELKPENTLEHLYLQPLDSLAKLNKGYIYKDSSKRLQLLIDIKTDSIVTLNKLIEVLQQYPSLINNKTIRFVITGNRPAADSFPAYPSFIWFDGKLHVNYSAKAMFRIVMLSDDLSNYTSWKGTQGINKYDRHTIQQAIAKAHQVHKPVRFWNAPDFTDAWKQLTTLKVDYINTDHIGELADFLNHQNSFPVK